MKEVCPRCGGELVDGVCPACGSFHTLVTPAEEGEALAGRYILVQLLGRGGMGMVYLATDTHLGQQVAVKLLPPEVSGDIAAIEALKKEVLLARQLHHDNIAAVFNLETDPDRGCFIVMEFIDGADLTSIAGRREGRRLAVTEVVALAKGVAAALDYAHSKKIVHRDIKPKNIMLSRDGVVKVTDFGIARRLVEATLQTRVVGTLPYMAPEVLRGRPPSPATDIYALAATLYELLAGHPPFHKGDIYAQILNEPPPPIPDLSKELNYVLIRGLAKSPQKRYASAGALYEALAATTQQKGDLAALTMAIPKRSLKAVKEVPTEDLLKRAQAASEKGDFSQALALLRQAMRRHPSETVREMIYAVEKQQKEFYRYLEEGDEAASAGHHEKALQSYRKAQKVRDSEMLRQRIAASSRAIADGLAASADKALRSHSLEEALRLANEALEFCCDHEGARGVIATVEALRADVERHLEKARRSLRERNYEAALSSADEALQLLPNHPEALSIKKEAQRAKIRLESLTRQAEAATAACRYAEAIRLLEEAIRIRPDKKLGEMLQEARQLAAAGSLIRPIKSLPLPSPPRSAAHSPQNTLVSSDLSVIWLRESAPPIQLPLPRTPLCLAASEDFVAFALPDRLFLLPQKMHHFLGEHTACTLRPQFRKPHWVMRPFLRGVLLAALAAALLSPTLFLRLHLIEKEQFLASTRLMLFILPLLGLLFTLLISPKRAWILGWARPVRIPRPLALAFAKGKLCLAHTGGLLFLAPAGERWGLLHFILWFANACIWLFGLWFGIALGLKFAGYGVVWNAIERVATGLGLTLPRWFYVAGGCAVMRLLILLVELWMGCARRVRKEGVERSVRLAGVTENVAALAFDGGIYIRTKESWSIIPTHAEAIYANGDHIAGLTRGEAVVWSADGTQVCRFKVGDARRVVVDADGVCLGVLKEKRLAIYRLPHTKPAQIIADVVCVDCTGEVMLVGRQGELELWGVAKGEK